MLRSEVFGNGYRSFNRVHVGVPEKRLLAPLGPPGSRESIYGSLSSRLLSGAFL